MTKKNENDYVFQNLFTASETVDLIGQNYLSALLGKGRYADQYNLTRVWVGGQCMFLASEVYDMGIDLATNPRRARKLTDVERSGVRERFIAKYRAKKHVIGQQRRGRLSDWADIDNAKELLGVTTRQGVYRLADFHNGPIKTQVIGNTRVYRIEDIHDLLMRRGLDSNKDKKLMSSVV